MIREVAGFNHRIVKSFGSDIKGLYSTWKPPIQTLTLQTKERKNWYVMVPLTNKRYEAWYYDIVDAESSVGWFAQIIIHNI